MSDPLRDRLEAAGAQLAAADAARSAALAEIAAAMQAGEGSVPIRDMARLAGVSHVTAYRLLEKRP